MNSYWYRNGQYRINNDADKITSPIAAVYWLIREHEIQTGVNTKSVAMY